MKNTGIKITILAVTIVGGVAAVMVFYKTQIAPPTKVQFVEQHQPTLSTDLENFSFTQSEEVSDSLFHAYVDKIAVYEDNQFISHDQADADKTKLLDNYVPIYTKRCLAVFETNGWGEKCFAPINTRLAEIRAIHLSDESEAVQGNNNQDLLQIENVMGDYSNAKSLLKRGSYFTSVDEARRTITSATQWLGVQYIQVSDLVPQLQAVRQKLAQSHFATLTAHVNKLKNYQDMTESEFDSQVSLANNKINEYNQCKSMYGTYARNTSDLQSTAGDLYRTAKQYYNSFKTHDDYWY